MDLLRITRNGGDVERFHSSNMVKSQDVAQHSYNAAFIAEYLAEAAGIMADNHKVVMHMLIHDIPEQAIGDTPGWAKVGSSKLKEALDEVEYEWCQENLCQRHHRFMYDLNWTEQAICKFSDLAECAHKLVQEVKMGNRTRSDDAVSLVSSLDSRMLGVYNDQELIRAANEIVKDLETQLGRLI